MDRRTFLAWATNGMGAVVGAVLGLPALAYLADPRNRPGRDTAWRTVLRLGDLKPLEPKEAVIKETRRDAWNLHPDDIVGRVWLVRQDDEDNVVAFTTICPHLGCSINWIPPSPGRPPQDGQFLCPCHGGRFAETGQRVLDGPAHNPAPRNMDRLQVRVVAGPANPEDKVVQVQYKRFKTMQEKQEEDA
jgi:menaquinol-cytochrome c reductase iron-sulfur subunit